MIEKNNGGPAFPHQMSNLAEPYTGGMTLRDAFAIAALQGYMANPTSFGPEVPDGVKSDPAMVAAIGATFAYMIADAMLKARNA